ncbi:MAG: YbaK/EbsC family protein [Pseudomonadota bacterium]
MDSLHPSAQKVQEALRAQGLECIVREFPEGTRTSEDAAKAAGCALGQIAKSLIFRGKSSNRPVMVIASGVNRVDERAVGRLLGEKIGRADPDFVRKNTGFAIGGVPAVAHLVPPVAFIDEDLLQYDQVWSAAGTPNAVFPLSPDQLVHLTGGQVASLKKA